MTPKYRVWADGKMQKVLEIRDYWQWVNIVAEDAKVYRPWEYELMQWLWFQDNNWVDIYEGDISEWRVVIGNKYEHPHLLNNID